MQRRSFIKNSLALGGAMAIIPQLSFSLELDTKNQTRTFHLMNTFDFSHVGSEESTRLWVPLPLDSDYQKITGLKYEGDYAKAEITTDSVYGAKTLYAEWPAAQKDKALTLHFSVTTENRSADLSKAKDTQNYPAEAQQFLKGTSHIPVNDQIREFVKPIIAQSGTPLEKAEALYAWTCKNMYRDPDVVGCGLGDAERAISEKIFGGKCTDISSVFTALMRNAGIPCREVFGLRLGQSSISNSFGKADKKGLAKVSGGQHCRAEFWLDGIGWTPADPADVTKVALQEKLSKTSKRVQEIQKFQFGNWEMNWVAFNHARDFVLSPKPTQYPLNMLGYPYAEYGDEVLDYYAPGAFKYTYLSQEKMA